MNNLIRTDVNGLVDYLEKTGNKLSKSFIYSLVRRNKIPHKRVGTKIIFDIASIEKWLEPDWSDELDDTNNVS